MGSVLLLILASALGGRWEASVKLIVGARGMELAILMALVSAIKGSPSTLPQKNVSFHVWATPVLSATLPIRSLALQDVLKEHAKTVLASAGLASVVLPATWKLT